MQKSAFSRLVVTVTKINRAHIAYLSLRQLLFRLPILGKICCCRHHRLQALKEANCSCWMRLMLLLMKPISRYMLALLLFPKLASAQAVGGQHSSCGTDRWISAAQVVAQLLVGLVSNHSAIQVLAITHNAAFQRICNSTIQVSLAASALEYSCAAGCTAWIFLCQHRFRSNKGEGQWLWWAGALWKALKQPWTRSAADALPKRVETKAYSYSFL